MGNIPFMKSIDIDQFQERLRSAVNASEHDPKNASLAAGLNATFVRDTLSRRSVPKADNLFALAQVLNVSFMWLLTGKEEEPAQVQEIDVPVISWIQAGQINAADAIHIDADDYVTIDRVEGQLIALRVVGSSMNRKAPEGAVIVLDMDQRHPVDRLYYVAKRENEATFKQYRETDGPKRLEPDSNEKHDTIYLDDQWEIVGRVIRVVGKDL